MERRVPKFGQNLRSLEENGVNSRGPFVGIIVRSHECSLGVSIGNVAGTHVSGACAGKNYTSYTVVRGAGAGEHRLDRR